MRMTMTAQEGRKSGRGRGGRLRKAKQRRPQARAGGVGVGVIGNAAAVDDEYIVARVSACGDAGGLSFDGGYYCVCGRELKCGPGAVAWGGGS